MTATASVTATATSTPSIGIRPLATLAAKVLKPATSLPNFSHVFIIIMENKEATQVQDPTTAPYIATLARQYASASEYYAVTHPSLPNYLALTGGSTFSITTDCTGCFVNADNIASQLTAAKRSWKAYMESMPQPCYLDTTDSYAQRHNPFVYYDNIRTQPDQCQNDVPFTQFAQDLKANTLPDFSWISPNVCSDMHDCPVSTGDSWLKTWVPQITASPAWKDNGVLFIVWDEGTTGEGCCQVAEGGRVALLVISPLVKPGYVSNVQYDHYSLLRTIEEAWGLPYLAEAGNAATPTMTDFFGSGPG